MSLDIADRMVVTGMRAEQHDGPSWKRSTRTLLTGALPGPKRKSE